MNTLLKFLIAATVLMALSFTLPAQNIAGAWAGKLDVHGTKINFAIHFTEESEGWSAAFDSPDQGVFGHPFGSAEVEGDRFICRAPDAGIVVEGRCTGDEIKGEFMQGGLRIPLNLRRSDTASAGLQRPQNPQPPFPYSTEEVEIPGPVSGVTLAGTLTVPNAEARGSGGKGPFPAAILVSGSGPQDRDCTVMGHKPFLVLADCLTRAGIAVLRYDDRGTAGSAGDFSAAVTSDFADDAEAVWAFLREHSATDPDRTGVIGLSEGGIVGPMLSARRPEVAFTVMLAGPAVRGSALLPEQNEAIGRASGLAEEQLRAARRLNELIYDYAENAENAEAVRAGAAAFADEHAALYADGSADQLKALILEAATPWVHAFLRHDPQPDLASVNGPVLALYGGKDLQILSGQNAPAAEAALAKSGQKFTVKVFPDCNHLFQTAETGAPAEYSRIEETMSPEVMAEIRDFIFSLR